MVLGFAGAGNMATALARGWAAAERGPEAMLFCDAGSGRAARLAAEVGGEAVDSLSELALRSDAVILAMKPSGLETAAEQLGGAGDAIASVLAATPVSTAVMGCSPAYLAIVVQNLAEAGAAEGLDPEQAYELVIESFAGTVEVLRRYDPIEVRSTVASRGGATEAGLEALADAGAGDAFQAAVRASLERMRG
jgi:pyrroline-5-carboxylate reductase